MEDIKKLEFGVKNFSPSLSEKTGTDKQSSVSLVMFEGVH